MERYDVFELSLPAIKVIDPFKQTVEGTFTSQHECITVNGFYDGKDYKIRFMPSYCENYHYVVKGTDITDTSGDFEVTKETGYNHGPVGVAKGVHFSYRDGTPHYSFGTTAYAWCYQNDKLQKETIETLASSPFNKIRFCIFPKHYLYNLKDPAYFPFKRGHGEGLDLQQLEMNETYPPCKRDTSFNYFEYDTDTFKKIEENILKLRELNIEADLILFHPYDRWGFNCMNKEADDAYLKYAVSRFGAYRNVWWSLANEHDIMNQKTGKDWERYASIIQQYDPYHHLMSIHNCLVMYDHHKPWITHCSLQRIDVYRHVEYTDEYRNKWKKPIVWDEIAYEGNIDQGWGNISGEELTRRFWEAFMRGGYAGHGETYYNKEEILWWAHGGKLHGDSPERIAFLKKIIEETPVHGLKHVEGDWDEIVAGSDLSGFSKDDGYRIHYFGINRPSFRKFHSDLPVRVQIIDTWNMTIDEAGIHEGDFTIDLPSRSYMAVRFIKVTYYHKSSTK